jgi:hypothetical protein
MLALGDAVRRNIAGRVAERVAQSRSAKIQELGDADFRKLIAVCMEKADLYGVEGERDLATLAEFMVDISPDFDGTPKYEWARSLLSDSSLDSSLKIELLHFRMTGLSRPA